MPGKNKKINSLDFKYHLVIKNTDNSFSDSILVLFTILLNIILVIISIGMLESKRLFIVKYTAFWYIVDIYFIDQALWYLFGKEVILISDKLIILKKGKLFNTQKSFHFNKIISIQASEDTDTFKIQRDYLYMGGNIRINWINGYYRFGKNISLENAQKISREVTEIIKSGNVSDLTLPK